jgi:small subunit ribosomal protein S3
MGKKINPKIFRMGITRSWPSKWYARRKRLYQECRTGHRIRRFLLKTYKEAGVDRVEIERSAKKITISVYTAKPGLLIGRGGAGVDDLKSKIHRAYLKNFRPGDINLNIFEVDRPNLSAQIIVQSMILGYRKKNAFPQGNEAGFVQSG